MHRERNLPSQHRRALGPSGRVGAPFLRGAYSVIFRQDHTPPSGHWSLVGRNAELAALDTVASHVLRGRPHVVQIEGPAGIGKSALLSAWCRGDERFRVLRTRCHPLEQETVFGAVRQLFQPVIAPAGETARKSLPDSGAAALQFLDDTVPAPPVPGGPDTTAATLSGLDKLAERLSDQQPLLLIIDSPQWIDPPSLRWLVQYIRRVNTGPVLVVVVTPTAEFRKHDPLLAELLHPSHCHTIVLGPLSVPDVQQLTQAVWRDENPDPSFCASCHAATNGHPLFLHALLSHAQLSGLKPTAEHQDRIRTMSLTSLRGEILHRLSQASPAAVDLVRALAILGDRSSRHLLAAHCGRGEAVVQAAAAELRSLGLVRAEPDPGFVHPVVRDTVLEMMSPDEVSRGHARAAHVTFLGGRPDEEVAAHLLAADPTEDTWAVPSLRRAADQALRRGAPEAAATYLRCALRQPPQAAERGPLLLQLAVATSHYNAVQALSYATEALEALIDTTARRDALGLVTACLLLAPGTGTAPSVVDRLIAEVRSQADADGADQELALRVQVLRSLAECERPSALTTAPGAVPAVGVEHLLGRSLGERQLLALHAFRALRAGSPAPYVASLLDRASGTPPVLSPDVFPLHYFVAHTLLYLDEFDTADRMRAQLARATEGKSMELLDTSVTAYHAALALRRGNVTEALVAAQKAVDRGSATGRPPYSAALDAMRIDALLARGRVDAAEHVARTRSAEGWEEGAWEAPLFLMSLAALRTAQGDTRAGLSLLHECGHLFLASGTASPAICPWRSRAAAAHLVLGEASAAQELLDEELHLARRSQIPRAVGVALRMTGKSASGAQQLELLDEAVTTLTATPARLELARALHDLGVAQARRGGLGDARRALRKGLMLATECGATALAKRLRQQLHDAGGRAGKNGSGLLTPGEERVSALAAQGCSNKEIAERLFVSLRTVETHLTGAYRKLGISGRDQLAAAVAAPGTRSG
ncbi:helix-turn-helix transcriptional regulator [Streptomyces inhibens]|uniref:helix-turn-helix transcriptional regulator n=1 Tax=Streptomyces inhibens TaxID=2293571 RepID=UPI001EE7065A|nr:AAA family ATPase [Streptomyces inhibens]UKY47848.1 AAA family ATPase [Streptomyces inhibens]